MRTAPILTAPCLSEMFARVVHGIEDVLARGPSEPGAAPLLSPVLLAFLRGWLSRVAVRFGHLLRRAAAGRLSSWRTLPPSTGPVAPPSAEEPRLAWPAPQPAALAAPGAPAPPATRAPAVRLPGQYAWLAKMLPAARGPAFEMRQLLARPEMEAMLNIAPVACGRTLRTLCWAIGVQAPTVLARNVLRLPSPSDPPSIWKALLRPGPPRKHRRPKPRLPAAMAQTAREAPD